MVHLFFPDAVCPYSEYGWAIDVREEINYETLKELINKILLQFKNTFSPIYCIIVKCIIFLSAQFF